MRLTVRVFGVRVFEIELDELGIELLQLDDDTALPFGFAPTPDPEVALCSTC